MVYYAGMTHIVMNMNIISDRFLVAFASLQTYIYTYK